MFFLPWCPIWINSVKPETSVCSEYNTRIHYQHYNSTTVYSQQPNNNPARFFKPFVNSFGSRGDLWRSCLRKPCKKCRKKPAGSLSAPYFEKNTPLFSDRLFGCLGVLAENPTFLYITPHADFRFLAKTLRHPLVPTSFCSCVGGPPLISLVVLWFPIWYTWYHNNSALKSC
jgi:hypothetical protein